MEKKCQALKYFQKLHGTQHSLIIMLKKYKEALDKHKYTSVLYTDLSELFYSVKYSLLLSTLESYSFSQIIQCCICFRVMINNKRKCI